MLPKKFQIIVDKAKSFNQYPSLAHFLGRGIFLLIFPDLLRKK